ATSRSGNCRSWAIRSCATTLDRKDKRMRKIILPTGVAALLMAISAHATENPDMCAVVLKTPDGFLALRTKPEPKSKMMSKLFPGQVLRVDIDKYRRKNL